MAARTNRAVALMSLYHTRLTLHLTMIVRALSINQVPATNLAYLATEEEWQEIIKEVESLQLHPDADLSYAENFKYMGITILKPKSLCESG
jgi:hypothetical protein